MKRSRSDPYKALTEAGAKSQHMTVEDLEFLVHQQVALRFQHARYSEQMAAQGSIRGDAYSLSDPKEWIPATAEKAAQFEKALKEVVKDVVVAEGFASRDTNGSFLLLRGVENARVPARDRETYPGPLYSVGGLTKFMPHQQIGVVHIAQAREARHMTSASSIAHGIDRLTGHLSQKIIGQIKHARGQILTHAPDPEFAASEQRQDIDGIVRTRQNLAILADRRAKAGLPPLPKF